MILQGFISPYALDGILNGLERIEKDTKEGNFSGEIIKISGLIS
jgi:hypothetical protein